MEKYDQNRSLISTGDLILFRNNKTRKSLSKLIQKFDKAYYNHIGVVFSFGEGANRRLMIIDSNAKGVQPDMLSARMNIYEDFCVLKPRPDWREQPRIEEAVSNVMAQADSRIEYDIPLLLEIAIERSLGRNVMSLNQQNKDICSEFAYRYAKALFSIAYDLTREQWGWISPQDFLRFRDKKEFNLLLDTNPQSHPDYDGGNKK